MFSYIVGFVAFLVLFYNPLTEILSPGTPRIRRTPLPQINTDLLALEDAGNETSIQCPEDSYSIHVFSREPLVLYIEGFLRPEEQTHLLDISEPIFTPSTVTHDGSSVHRDTSVRDSEVALVPRTASVKCIESRARALQGWRDEVWIERLRVQRYHPGGHYGHHFDWSSGRGGWGRVSSFMAWVAEDGLEGGGTEFPALSRKGDPRWCRFVECGEGGGGGGGGGANNGNNGANASASTTTSTLADRSEQSGEAVNGDGGERGGVVFKPLVGNAVYWENFRADGSGRGYEESWHAGLPVVQGVKVGLNIWSWGRID